MEPLILVEQFLHFKFAIFALVLQCLSKDILFLLIAIEA